MLRVLGNVVAFVLVGVCLGQQPQQTHLALTELPGHMSVCPDTSSKIACMN